MNQHLARYQIQILIILHSVYYILIVVSNIHLPTVDFSRTSQQDNFVDCRNTPPQVSLEQEILARQFAKGILLLTLEIVNVIGVLE